MANWYILVEDSTGRNISESSAPIVNPKAGLVVVESNTREGAWNPTTRIFDPIELHRVVSLQYFIFLFTEDEREAIHVKAKTNDKAAEFVETLKILQSVDLDSDYIIGRVNLMETAGVVGQGRAAVILNG